MTRWACLAVAAALLLAESCGRGARQPSVVVATPPRGEAAPELTPEWAYQSGAEGNDAAASVLASDDGVHLVVVDDLLTPQERLTLRRVVEGAAPEPGRALAVSSTALSMTSHALAPAGKCGLWLGASWDGIDEARVALLGADGAIAWTRSAGHAGIGVAAHPDGVLVVRSPRTPDASPADSSVQLLSIDGALRWEDPLDGTYNRGAAGATGTALVATSCPACEPARVPVLVRTDRDGHALSRVALSGYGLVYDVVPLDGERFAAVAVQADERRTVNLLWVDAAGTVTVSTLPEDVHVDLLRAASGRDAVYVAYWANGSDLRLLKATASGEVRVWHLASTVSESDLAIADLSVGSDGVVYLAGYVAGDVMMGAQPLVPRDGFDAVLLAYPGGDASMDELHVR